jgi:carboxyl-terminal processing protease
MRKLRLEIVLPIGFLVFAAFIGGFMSKDIAAGTRSRDGMIASLQLLPQRIEGLNEGRSSSPDAEMPLLETYSNVMSKLKSEYYGKKIDEQETTYDAIRGVLHALGDPFTRFMDPEAYKSMREENQGTFAGIGAQLDTNKNLEVFVKEPIPNAPAQKAGVKKGDVILAVNGHVIKNMEIEKVVSLIRGPEGSKVKLTLQRSGVAKPFIIAIIRQQVQFQMVKSRMLDDKNKIGYIRLYQFNEQSDVQFDQALASLEKQHMKGLVFDLRGNPGGLLNIARDIGSRFIKSGPVVIIQERGGQKNPLYVEEDKHNHKMYPLAVLVDKSSASASEIVSGAIKDLGVGTLVGVTTFGKGRVQTIMPLQDGSAVAITTAKYLTPNGTDIHKKGITPDVIVEASENWDPDNVKTDKQLAKAIDVIKGKLGANGSATAPAK